MSKFIAGFFLFSILFLVFATDVNAQKTVGIPVKIEGFVLEFDAPYTVMKIEVGKNLFETNETIVLLINADTKILDHKGKNLADKADLVISSKVNVAAEKYGSQFTASIIKADKDLNDQEVSGYYERLDKSTSEQIAWISGQAVKLAPGTKVKGTEQWKNRTFASFDDMMLGSQVKVKGKRDSTGVFIARQGETRPNMFTNTDRKLRDLVKNKSQEQLNGANLTGKTLSVDKSGKWLFKDEETGKELWATNSKSPNILKVRVEGKEIYIKSLAEYVSEVGNKVVPQYLREMPDNDPSKINFRFFIKADDSFNAFALPDGTIVVHTGLLKNLKNESQLAAILGHEVAHVTHEHARRKISTVNKLSWIQIGAAIALGQGGANLGGLVAGLFALDFSRDMEDEADRAGLFYMANAGYDPREAPRVWQQVVDKTGKVSKVNNLLMSGHSTPQDRLRNLNREISRNYRSYDFSTTNRGEESYIVNIGFNFGWLKLVENEETKIKKVEPKSTPPIKPVTPGKGGKTTKKKN